MTLRPLPWVRRHKFTTDDVPDDLLWILEPDEVVVERLVRGERTPHSVRERIHASRTLLDKGMSATAIARHIGVDYNQVKFALETPDDYVTTVERQEVLAAMFRRVAPDVRRAYLGGMSRKECGRRLGVNVCTVDRILRSLEFDSSLAS